MLSGVLTSFNNSQVLIFCFSQFAHSKVVVPVNIQPIFGGGSVELFPLEQRGEQDVPMLEGAANAGLSDVGGVVGEESKE